MSGKDGIFFVRDTFLYKKDITMIRALCTIVLVVAVALYLSLVYGYDESFDVPDDWPDAEVPFFDKIIREAPEDETVYTERPYQVSTSQSPTTTTTLKPTTKAVLASIGATPTPVVCHDISGDIHTERPYQVSTSQSPTTTTTLKPTTKAVLASIGATPTPVVCHDISGDIPGVRCDDLVAMGFTYITSVKTNPRRRVRIGALSAIGKRSVSGALVKKPGVNCKRIPYRPRNRIGALHAIGKRSVSGALVKTPIPYITSVKTNPRRRVRIGALSVIGKRSVSGASSASTPLTLTRTSSRWKLEHASHEEKA
ncbi:hypothetical protein [Cod iridovirus]|uniref:Uncharacterized protein n=1 Tax=Cod iridovirus TaxID=1887316 RepID=A0A345ISV9_FRG3V|nr:hypothetical protein [Cod iridovirus]